MPDTAPAMFWMLLVDGKAETRHKHYSRHLAEDEANRLVRLTGRPVTLLTAVGVYETATPPITYTCCVDDNRAFPTS